MSCNCHCGDIRTQHAESCVMAINPKMVDEDGIPLSDYPTCGECASVLFCGFSMGEHDCGLKNEVVVETFNPSDHLPEILDWFKRVVKE